MTQRQMIDHMKEVLRGTYRGMYWTRDTLVIALSELVTEESIKVSEVLNESFASLAQAEKQIDELESRK